MKEYLKTAALLAIMGIMVYLLTSCASKPKAEGCYITKIDCEGAVKFCELTFDDNTNFYFDKNYAHMLKVGDSICKGK